MWVWLKRVAWLIGVILFLVGARLGTGSAAAQVAGATRLSAALNRM